MYSCQRAGKTFLLQTSIPEKSLKQSSQTAFFDVISSDYETLTASFSCRKSK